MRKDMWFVLGLGVALAAAGSARADVWDIQTSSDNIPATTQNSPLPRANDARSDAVCERLGEPC